MVVTGGYRGLYMVNCGYEGLYWVIHVVMGDYDNVLQLGI